MTPRTSDIDEYFEKLPRNHRHESLATSQSTAFMRELSLHSALNIVGHIILPSSGVDEVVLELNSLIELCELILSKGQDVNSASLQRMWPTYAQLVERAEELEEQVFAQFGKRMTVGRVASGTAFTLKRPFATRRVAHFERILSDEGFRLAEFRNVQG